MYRNTSIIAVYNLIPKFQLLRSKFESSRPQDVAHYICNQNVKGAWSEVTSRNLTAVWQKIIPHCANDFKGFENEVTRVINDITKLGFDLGLKETEKGDVQDLLQSHNKELDDEDLIKLERESAYDAQIDDSDEQTDVALKEFTLKEIDEMFTIAEIFKEKILNSYPNLE
jgi:hypothetical protein